MTQPRPADHTLDAPSLIGTGVDTMAQTIGRLGVAWELLLGTVFGTPTVSTVNIICDGDTAPLTAFIIKRAPDSTPSLVAGDRVHILRVPPSGLFVLDPES